MGQPVAASACERRGGYAELLDALLGGLLISRLGAVLRAHHKSFIGCFELADAAESASGMRSRRNLHALKAASAGRSVTSERNRLILAIAVRRRTSALRAETYLICSASERAVSHLKTGSGKPSSRATRRTRNVRSARSQTDRAVLLQTENRYGGES